jgi:hypothetical protein
MGLVLEQEEEQGWWPLAFYSRTWRPNERNWPTHHQEMAALVEALKKWRHYLLDKRIVAQTDSKFVERTNTQKATAGRLVRWWETFTEYNVEFQHIEGQRNIVTDALSRSFPKVSHEHIFFVTAQPSHAKQISDTTETASDGRGTASNYGRAALEDTRVAVEVSNEHDFFATAVPSHAKQISQSARKDQDGDTDKSAESHKVSHEHIFFATAQPSHAKQISDTTETASDGRGTALDGRGTASDGRGTASDGRGTASDDSGTALDYSSMAPKVSNEHDFFATALPSHAEQIPLALAVMEKGRLAFDYEGDTEFGEMWKRARDMKALVNGNLRIGELVCVPKADREVVLRACHDEEGHLGGEKLAKRLSTLFYWEKLQQDCVEFAQTCQLCQTNKTDHQKPAGLLHPLPAPNRPMEHITIDFFFDLPVTEGGWNGVWLVVDRFSKLVKLISVKKEMSVERLIRQYMIYVYCNYGLPASIVSD